VESLVGACALAGASSAISATKAARTRQVAANLPRGAENRRQWCRSNRLVASH
jgi:hypothetical protein